MLKKLLIFLKYIGLFATIGLLVFGIIWANHQLSGEKCRNIVIDIVNTDSLSFVTEGNIINILNKAKLNPTGKLITSINTDLMEKTLNQSEYIENAECIILPNNIIQVIVTQLIPILRVFNEDESYYLNKNGKRMNANGRFHADVPIVTGNFNNHADALLVKPITEFVKHDKDLHDLITMYSVRDSNNIFIVPCIYGHIINFGDNSNIENKFAKLKKFYREVMPVKGWLTYDTITLKWNHQIVANRRSKKIKQKIIYNPEEEEVAPPVESIIITGINDPSTLEKDHSVSIAKTTKDTATISTEKKVANAFNQNDTF